METFVNNYVFCKELSTHTTNKQTIQLKFQEKRNNVYGQKSYLQIYEGHFNVTFFT